MDINLVFYGVGVLGSMGLLFGAGLAYASKKFAVEVDERVVLVREALPGANCGACGFPGCDGFANAVVQGNAPINGCPVGGSETVVQISQIMGVEAVSTTKKVARVKCKGDDTVCINKFNYSGYDSCVAANMLSGGPKSCSFGCMGLGSCVQVCDFDAIFINDKGIAEVNKEKCTACLKCIKICPKMVISLVPYFETEFTVVECNNREIGGHVKKNCSVACISCKICERNCPHDAIHVNNNLADIDYEKCQNCGICVSKCPTKCIDGPVS